ncbi:hypothetical protein EYF80_003422 [Liparis tanakae]|uniref:Uncharacterized protein n=1 Tax=Liparis tanakae TaxID=230148 RepID=A0A4Z2J8J8_9TELE|nr:hypothetical protein EYF80_003422 [Liparis tanakae]
MSDTPLQRNGTATIVDVEAAGLHQPLCSSTARLAADRRLLVEGGMKKEEKEEHEREMGNRRNRKCEEEVAWMEGGTGGRRGGTVLRKERMRERMGSKEEEWEGRESGKR